MEFVRSFINSTIAAVIFALSVYLIDGFILDVFRITVAVGMESLLPGNFYIWLGLAFLIGYLTSKFFD